VIDTERLILRGWRQEDHVPFHAMGNDPRVMRFLGAALTEAEVTATIERQNQVLDHHGYCFWAIERRTDGEFLGFCGIKPGPAGTPIAGELEIGWRLAHDYWGQGYAREAAQASLDWTWRNLDAPHVAAMTVQANEASWGLMTRLGMHRVIGGDFDHPLVPEGDPLRRHILYRIERPA
jgi:RimJ/RimL family protein N-acetyltransferase